MQVVPFRIGNTDPPARLSDKEKKMLARLNEARTLLRDRSVAFVAITVVATDGRVIHGDLTL